MDYSLTSHVNFEADIRFPEEEGIVQVETFGSIDARRWDNVLRNANWKAVMDRIKDNISLDHLSRLLVDVHQDGSKIVDSVISAYQRNLMDPSYLITMLQAVTKFSLPLNSKRDNATFDSRRIHGYKGEHENELKQVVGETRAAFDISEHDTLIFWSAWDVTRWS